METPAKKKTVIGWSEFIDLPNWHVHSLKAKIDTGARTSALHVEELRQISPNYVEFMVVLNRKKPSRRKRVRAKVVKWAKVRSSTGEYTRRCFVKTLIQIGPIEKEVEISLVSREKMQFRMLIGRKTLQKDFLVDVSKRSVVSEHPKKKKKLPS